MHEKFPPSSEEVSSDYPKEETEYLVLTSRLDRPARHLVRWLVVWWAFHKKRVWVGAWIGGLVTIAFGLARYNFFSTFLILLLLLCGILIGLLAALHLTS